jgi:hypothetical protein
LKCNKFYTYILIHNLSEVIYYICILNTRVHMHKTKLILMHAEPKIRLFINFSKQNAHNMQVHCTYVHFNTLIQHEPKLRPFYACVPQLPSFLWDFRSITYRTGENIFIHFMYTHYKLCLIYALIQFFNSSYLYFL